jgi:hypothetical protein
VLQFLIDLRQDQGFKLSELVLELSFTETDPHIDATSYQPTSCGPSLNILRLPSPQNIKGGTVTQHASRELMAQPQIDVGGIGVGGIGVRVSIDRDIQRSWHFRSHRSDNGHPLYTNAQWIRQAPAENPDIEDIGALYTGVTIEHTGQPFYLTCRVEGKLAALQKRFRYWQAKKIPYFAVINPKPSQQSIQKGVEELEDEIIKLITRGAASK